MGLRESCQILGWSATETAERLGCNSRLVQRWWAKQPGYEPPSVVEEWASKLAKYVESHPPPEWKRR